LQSCQCSTTIKSCICSHPWYNLTQVVRFSFSYRHAKQLRNHRGVQATSKAVIASTKTTYASTQETRQEGLFSRSAIYPYSSWHLSTISSAMRFPRNWRHTSCGVTLYSSPSLLNSCTRSITANKISPAGISGQHQGILVIGCRATISWNLPSWGTLPSHQVNAVINFIQVRIIAAHVVPAIPIQFT